MVRRYDHVKPRRDLERWLELRGHDRGRVRRDCDTFRDPRVWRVEDGQWVKDNIWGEPSAYGPMRELTPTRVGRCLRSAAPAILREGTSDRRNCWASRRRGSQTTSSAARDGTAISLRCHVRPVALRTAPRRSRSTNCVSRMRPLRNDLHDSATYPGNPRGVLLESQNYAYWNDVIFPASEAVRREKIFRPRAQRMADLCRRVGVTGGSSSR